MNLLNILISFALVNVLVALDMYTKQVIMTNQQMMLVRADLPRIIQNVILLGDFTIVELGLMFAVPDAQNRDIEDYIKQQKIDYQYIVQDKIWYLTSTIAPEINEDRYKNTHLISLGIERRIMTLEATKSLIRAVIRRHNKSFKDFTKICLLIGLYRSIRYQSTFIVNADVNAIGVCSLGDIRGVVNRYCKIEGNIWEIDVNDTPKHLLFSQV